MISEAVQVECRCSARTEYGRTFCRRSVIREAPCIVRTV